MANDCLLPEKFLCRYSLKVGAVVVGIVMCCVMVICVIVSFVELSALYNSPEHDRHSWLKAYSITVVSCTYCILMVGINIWFLLGIKKDNTTMTLIWIMCTALWLGMYFALFMVLIVLYAWRSQFVVWLICLLLGLVSFALLDYGFFCVYAYWADLKNREVGSTNRNQDA